MTDRERKCQAECGHSERKHHRSASGTEWCEDCYYEAIMNTTTPNVYTPTHGALKHVHEFETLDSLRAEVEACLAAHTAFVTKVENIVGRWPGDREGDYAVITALLSFRTEKNNADHAHLQAAARAAALTAERDEARRTAAKAEHEINVANATIHEMELEYTTLRPLVLTDEACGLLASDIVMGLEGAISSRIVRLHWVTDAIRAARGIKEKP